MSKFDGIIGNFEGIIGNLVSGLFINNIMDVEDVKQELRMKLLQVIPQLSHVPKEEIYQTVKPILRNRLIDIIRYNKYRPDTSYHAATEDMDIVVSNGADFFSATIMSPTNSASYNELTERLIDWAEDFFHKDWEVNFISQLIKPSKSTLDEYEKLTVNNPRVSGLSYMAPMTLGRVLGLSSKQVCRIIFYVREFLTDSGYAPTAC